MRRRKSKGFFNKNNMLGLLIIFIMISSGIGFMAGNNAPPGAESYNGHVLERGNDNWFVKHNENYVQFTYFPDILENIEISTEAVSTIGNSQALLFAFNPYDDSISQIEAVRLDFELGFPKVFEKAVLSAVTVEDSELYPGYFKIGCENASAQVPVVIFESGESNEFVYSNNCLRVVGDSQSGVKMMRDRLLYGMLGVI